MGILFKQQNFSLRVFLSSCEIFGQFQPGFAYKSIAYKKSVYTPLKDDKQSLCLENIKFSAETNSNKNYMKIKLRKITNYKYLEEERSAANNSFK